MKSIISRYGEMTTNPTKLVDAEGEEMSLNKVDKALQTVGISIHDAQGQFRDFDDVIMELAASWDTIDKNTQRYIATVMAGNRQQSRFLALVSNYERLVELSDEAANSEDAATLQVMKTMDSVSAKAQQLQTSLQSMYTQTGLEEFYKGVLDFTNGIIATFTQMPTIFKLPIPAILAFGQMFINVGTSLASVIKMLRDKLSTASAATEKDMHTAQEIAGKQRITTEEKVWLERVQAAKKGAEQINGIERGIADTANQVANQRIGAAQQPTITPTIDFSKFNRDLGPVEGWYQALTGNDQRSRDIAVKYFQQDSMQQALKEQGLQLQGYEIIKIGDAARDASEKTQGLWASLQQNKAATIGLRMVGSSISLIAASMGEATESARALKGGLQLVGGAMQAVSYAAMKNPYMAIFTGVMTAVQVLSTWIETDAERLERLKKAADESNTNYLQKKQDYKNLDDQIKKLKELEKAQYDSEEAQQAYIEASNRLAETHPEMIAGLDAEGNAVIDLADTYGVLTKAKEEATRAAEQAVRDSVVQAEETQRQAENRRSEQQAAAITDWVNTAPQNAFDYFFEPIFKGIKENLQEGLTYEEFKKNIAFVNGRITEYEDEVSEIFGDTSEQAQIFRDMANSYRAFANPDTLEGLSGTYTDLFNQISDEQVKAQLQELPPLIEQEDIEGIRNFLHNNIQLIQDVINDENTPKYIQNMLSSLGELNGNFEGIEHDIQTASDQTKAVVRSSLTTLLSIPFMGSEEEIDTFYKEMENANNMLTKYMMSKAEEWAATTDQEDKSFSAFFDTDEYSQYLQSAREAIGNTWIGLTQSAKNEVNDLIKNRGKYTDSQLREQLIDNLGWDENKLEPAQEDLLETFTGGYDYLDAIQAITNRQNKQLKNKRLLSGGKIAELDLGSDELQTYVNTYDNIASMLEQDKISLSSANQAMENYYKLWESAKGDEAAQALVNEFDDFSLAGLEEFRKSVRESLLSKEDQKALIEAAENLVNSMPINLETEFQTFSQKISSNMEDFEKAISNASKGMDMKDALELARKMDTTLDSFDLNNGKFFYTNLNDIKDAYFKGTSQYLEDLNAEYDEEIQKLKDDIIRRRKEGADATSLEKQLSEAETNQKVINDKFEEYTNYQLNSILIQTGQIRLFLENILGQDSPDIDTQLSHINKGEYDKLTPEIQLYTAELYDYVNKIQKDIFDKAISSISGEGPQMIDATDATEAQKEILNALGKEVPSGKYLIDLSLKNIQEVQEQIRTAIRTGIITQKQGNDYMAELHKIEFGDNLSNSVQDVLKSYNDIGYDALQSLANALNTSVDTLIGGGQFKDIAPFEIKDNGNFKANLERLNEFLSAHYYELSNESYNSIRALFEQASFNENQNKNIIFNKLVANRNKITEEDIGNLATALNTRYDAIKEILIANDDGTYQLNLATIKELINTYQIEITDELEQLLANEIDSIIASLNGLGDIQSKGTTKIADMQKQVAEINKLSGQNYTMQDLFTYSDTLHGFVYSSQGLVESARQMKEQLETLSGDERWAAEQMLENTRNTFLQNIDITGFLNAERITPQIEKNLLNSIDAFNKYTSAIGDSSHIMKYSLIRTLKKGGAQAVAAAQTIAAEQGKELSASDVEAAYRREVKSLVDAIDTVTSGAGALVDETTANLINAAGGKAIELAGTGQYVVESAANLYDAYNELLNRLKDTGEATLADINKVAALALENKDGEQQAIDALGDAAGMTYTRFGEILAQAGYELSEELMSQLTSAGIVKQLGGSKMQITDFSAFADLMDWDAGSEEYVSAFKSYNDSLIEMNRKAEKNILEEAKNLENAKAGDQFNLTQLSDTLNKVYQDNIEKILNENIFSSMVTDEGKLAAASKTAFNPLTTLTQILQQYGAELKDGILTIGSDVNLPAIIQEISNAAQQYGGLLSSEMAELADVLANVLKNYAELIQNGIKGTLSNVQADELKGLGKQLGVEVDFTKTKEGLKATQQSAIQLYNELKKIDALQGQMTLETLADSLEASNENYANVSTITARIAELQREIANLKPGDARLQMYREELATAEDILRVRSSTDSGSFDFMNRDLPNGMQNPIDYWNSTGEAYKAMNQAAKSGYMEIQDFYNIVNEMNNMAAVSGNTLSFMGQTLSGKAEDAAALIEAGMSALKNVDGEGVKIALGSLGADFATGAADMTGDFDTGIKEMAKSQIKMLDAAIRMLEAIVAMENIDANGDGLFDPSEIFADGSGLTSKDFTPAMNSWIRQMDAAAGGIEIGGKSLLEALQSLEPDQIVSLLNQLRSIDWTIGDADTFTQIQNVLSSFFIGKEITQRGPNIFDILDVPSDADTKLNKFNDWCTKAGLSAKEGERLYNRLTSGRDIPINQLGTDKENNYFTAIAKLLDLDTQQKRDTLKTFAGENGLSQEEIQLWSQIDVTWNSKGVKSAIYTDSEGEDHDLQGSDASEWSSLIKQIEEEINNKRTILDAGGSQSDTTGAKTGETLKLREGIEIESVIDGKGKYYFKFNGKSYGPYDDPAKAEEALKQIEEQSRVITGGEQTIDGETGKIITKNGWTIEVEDDITQEERNRRETAKTILEKVSKGDKLDTDLQKEFDSWFNEEDRTIKIPGFEAYTLKPGETKEDAITQLTKALFPDNFSELPTKISEGITKAFGGEGGAAIGQALMQGITDSLTALTEITPGQLPEVASALGQVATQGERLKAIPWDTIVAGIRAIANVQNGGNDGEGPKPGEKKDPSVTGERGFVPKNNTMQPIKLEDVKADKVDATGATIDASGASINTGNTGSEKGEENNNSNISSITTSGAINVTGSPVNVAGTSTGGNGSGGETKTPTLDISGITGALDSLQSALSAPTSAISLLTGAIQAIPTDKAQAVRNTANAINQLKDKNITVKATVQGTIRASMSATVSVDGAASASADAQIAEKKIITSSGAKGNVALAKGTNLSLATGKKQTLMGELGPELVVSNGRYYTVGNNGAEFVDLPEDAIVFNHKQTRKLLGNKGSIKGRGKPVKSENAAISFATGNVTGPAMAGAAAALAALKQIRSMWQSMLDASAKDLGSQAGAGRGGGGGGGGGGGDKNNARYIHDLEIWYNLLRQIAKLEKDISLEEAKQNKLQSDRIANGNKIYQSYKAELKYLDQSIAKNTQLVTLRKKYYEDATNKLKDTKNPFSKLFTFTSDGVLQYDTNLEDYINMITKSGNSNFKNGKLHLQGTSIVRDAEGKAIKYKKGKNKGKAKTTTFNKDIDIANSAMDFLALLNATNENGAAAYSPEEQVAILKAYGFGNVIQYDEKGQKITGDDAAIKMVENFWNQFDNIIKNTDDLFDDYLEGLHKIEELESQQNDVLDKIRDNQIDLENKVLDAIVAREQQRIDDAQDERDALEKANQKFLDGLNDSLQKERDLYQRNQDSQELNKLQRQLAILQRSGGSASQIRNLQDQINQKQRDSYFTAQEDQINAIQEASDLQIERLDAQIDIMTETLEYQKENGLLWGEVYQIMSGSAEQIVDFIQRYDKEFLSKGLTEQQKDTVDLLESAQIFDSDRGFENSKRQAWEEYLSKHTELQTEANAEKRVQIKQAFDENYNSTKNAQSAGNAAEIKRAQLFSSNSGNNSSNTQQSSGTIKSTPTPTQSTSVWSAELASAKVPYYSKVNSTKKAGNLTNKKNERVEIIKDNAGKNKKLGTMVQIRYNGKEYYVPQSKFKKSSYQKAMLNPKGAFTGIQFAKGGLVDFTGPAWVDGTPTKPEAFLNAEQTASLKKGLFNSELVTASIDNLRAGWDEFREQVVNNISNNSNETVVIEKAEVNMNVSQINDDYGAHRAGQEVMAEMLKIANKSGTRAITRR